MANYVLVHGAWQGSWVYTRIARILRDAGHQVFAATLTGLGERAHLASGAINLDTHIQDVVNLFLYEDISDAILCGHSYGGMVISGAVGKLGNRVRSLVYIDAYVPSDGQSLIDMVGAETALAFLDRAKEHGGGMIPPISAAEFNTNRTDADWVDTMSVQQPLATFVQAVRLNKDLEDILSKTYIFATANGVDQFVTTHLRLKSDPRWKVHEVACGHEIMLDRPMELAALLAAEETTKPARQNPVDS